MAAHDSPTEENELTPKQEQLIASLVAGNIIAVAAKAVGIGERTAYRWLKLPHFQVAYRDAKQVAFNEKLDKLRDGVSIALKTLLKHMTNEETPANVQVRCAQIWLEQSIEIHKMSELEARLQELEGALKASRV